MGIAALNKSKSGLLEVNEEGSGKIRRDPSKPLPDNTDDHQKLVQARTAYAKGYDKEKTTMDELLEYYEEHNPNIVNIQMRNYTDKKKHFKGSVFLTFNSEEACKAFVEAEVMKYKDVELTRMMQKPYLDMKAKEMEEKRNRRNGDKKAKADGDAGNNKQAASAAEEPLKELPKGTVIKFTGIEGDISREDLKAKLEQDFEVNTSKENGDIAFITFQRGDTEAKIRFKAENFGKTLMEKLNKAEKIVVKDIELKASLLEGEEEEKFLADSARDMMNQRNKGKNHKRRHNDRDGGRGGYQGKRFKKN